MGLNRLIAERKRSVPKVDNELTNEATKVATFEEEVDSESTSSDASRGSTIVANYCDLPDCVEPSRRPHDCAVCQFINWVDSALPGESYQLPEDWVPEAQELEEACNVAVKNRSPNLSFCLMGKDFLECRIELNKSNDSRKNQN